MTKISIAMATYNGESFIHRQLDSLAQQTLPPAELIVCDDGSTDSTVNIVNDFSRSAQFPVVIVKNKKRLGFTANFLQAVRMCHGDFIAFCDQDDEWLPHKLRRILEISRESDALLFAHADELIDRNGNSMGIVCPNDRPYRKFIRLNDFPGHAIVFRSDLLEMTSNSLTSSNYKEVAGDVEIGHDVLLVEIANAMGKVHFTPDVLVRWRFYTGPDHAPPSLTGPPRRTWVSFSDWLYPSDLAQRYASAASFHRKHSILLSCVVRDLALLGRDTEAARAKLTKLMNLLARRADVMELRARFYGPLSRKARIKLMLQGAAMGQYRNAKQGVRMHNALRDIIACLFKVERTQQPMPFG
jgi:glycosyltransferase involved in cell wall biosynthesis